MAQTHLSTKAREYFTRALNYLRKYKPLRHKTAKRKLKKWSRGRGMSDAERDAMLEVRDALDRSPFEAIAIVQKILNGRKKL